MHPLVEELGNGDQRGRPTTDPVEGGDHLGYGGHVHPACRDGADRRPDREAKERHDDAGRGEVQQWDGGEQGDHHADGGGLVTAAGAPRVAELLQAKDK